MSGSVILQRNLEALAAAQPEAARRLRGVEPSPEVVFLTSRGGALVPARRGGRRPVPLHSTVDPFKEGHRQLALHGSTGYLVVLGVGAGYHVLPLLTAEGVSRIVLVEADVPQFRAVLGSVDLRPLLGHSWVRLLLGVDPPSLRAFLLADYLPAVHGDLRTVPLQSVVTADPGRYGQLADAIQAAVAAVADDYSVQSRFGRRWFLNTLANLPAAQDCTVTLGPVPRAVVTGAGPSLETQVQHIPRLRAGACLIASDTSLPALRQYGILPDVVVSIDCQHISYHHFLQGLPPQVPLVLDLASPPLLARLAPRPLFFASGHPLSRLLAQRWRPLPLLDTSGGNVSHAAVSLALLLGAREVHLLGVDFSYPEGKAYSRGTYLYPVFHSAEQRLRPLEGQFFSFLMRNESLVRQRTPAGLRYGTPSLSAYRDRLQALADSAPGRVVSLPGKGLPLRQSPPQEQTGRDPGDAGLVAAGPARCGWREFLAGYIRGLESLPPPFAPAGRYLDGLAAEQLALWATLLPAAAALSVPREPHPVPTGEDLLAEVRNWSVSAARRFWDR